MYNFDHQPHRKALFATFQQKVANRMKQEGAVASLMSYIVKATYGKYKEYYESDRPPRKLQTTEIGKRLVRLQVSLYPGKGHPRHNDTCIYLMNLRNEEKAEKDLEAIADILIGDIIEDVKGQSTSLKELT